jgi:hypothetical protein
MTKIEAQELLSKAAASLETARFGLALGESLESVLGELEDCASAVCRTIDELDGEAQ